MSHSKNDVELLKHIQDALNNILVFTLDKNVNDLLDNKMLTQSLERNFEIMGEAASKISVAFKEKHDDIPWRDMIAMRNKLIHNYFDVNYTILFDTIVNDLPGLKLSVSKSLEYYSDKIIQNYSGKRK